MWLNSKEILSAKTLLAVALICLTPLAWATTGGGPMDGFVNEILEIITGWGGRSLILVALSLGIFTAVKSSTLLPVIVSGGIALIISYGPEYLLTLSGALI